MNDFTVVDNNEIGELKRKVEVLEDRVGKIEYILALAEYYQKNPPKEEDNVI